MNKAYIIWPFAGLLVFGVFYWNFSKEYALKQQKAEMAIQETKREKTRKELELRKKAIEDAIAAQQVRIVARAAKEKKEEEEKANRAALMDRRTKAYDDVNKRLHPQLERLKSDADEIKDQLAKLDLEKKTYGDEEAFLRTFVRQAEANVKTYYNLLDQLAAAEKARADAEAAAKKKS
jgi:valyl-tRNA synthetase